MKYTYLLILICLFTSCKFSKDIVKNNLIEFKDISTLIINEKKESLDRSDLSLPKEILSFMNKYDLFSIVIKDNYDGFGLCSKSVPVIIYIRDVSSFRAVDESIIYDYTLQDMNCSTLKSKGGTSGQKRQTFIPLDNYFYYNKNKWYWFSGS